MHIYDFRTGNNCFYVIFPNWVAVRPKIEFYCRKLVNAKTLKKHVKCYCDRPSENSRL